MFETFKSTVPDGLDLDGFPSDFPVVDPTIYRRELHPS